MDMNKLTKKMSGSRSRSTDNWNQVWASGDRCATPVPCFALMEEVSISPWSPGKRQFWALPKIPIIEQSTKGPPSGGLSYCCFPLGRPRLLLYL